MAELMKVNTSDPAARPPASVASVQERVRKLCPRRKPPRRLKDEIDSDIFTSASGTLIRAMLADGLVDELHLFVYPLTRGSGPRLFTEGAAPAEFIHAGSL